MNRYDGLDKEMDQILFFARQHLEKSKVNVEAVEPAIEVVEPVPTPDKPVEVKKQSLAQRLIRGSINVLYYGGLVMLLLLIATTFKSKDSVTTLAGYAPFYIETSSMNSVMPRGSLIVSKQVDPESLVVGDDITFFIESGKTVTHRVEKIHPNHNGQGLAFVTKGVDNKAEDVNPVYASDVIGKVVKVLPKVGIYLSYIKDNVVMVLVIVLLVGALLHMLKIFFSEGSATHQKV